MSNIKEVIKLVKKVKSDLWDYTSPNVNVKNEKLSEDIELLDQALANLRTEPEPTKWTVFIEYLELNQRLYCLEYDDHRIANITKEQFEDFEILLHKEQSEPKCETCSGSGKIPRKEKQHCRLLLCTDLSIPSCFRCQFYIHEKPCPDCQAPEQPPAGDFGEFMEEVKDEIRNAPKMFYQLQKRDELIKGLNRRLDRSEAENKKKDELLFAYESVRAPKQPPAGDFTKEMRILYELRPKVIEGKIVAKHIFDLCTRLDRSEASRRNLLLACKKVQQWLDTSSLQQVLVHYTEDERRHALIMGLATNLERLEAAIAKEKEVKI